MGPLLQRRVLIIPVHAPAYPVHVPQDSFDELYTLLGCACFSTVLLKPAADFGDLEVSLVCDDDGIANGAEPHLWVRGAVIHGPAAVLAYQGEGGQTDLGERLVANFQELLNSRVPKDVYWPLVTFSRIPPSLVKEAYTARAELHAAGIEQMRREFPGAAITDLESEAYAKRSKG